MKTMIAIQHTQAAHHTNGMVGSWTDWELTDKGQEYAENIGKRLAAELSGKCVKIYCSDLARTKQTAEPLSRELGLPVEYRMELREQNLGEACGQTRQWMRAHQMPVRTMDDRPFPSAESGREVWNRLSAFCDEMVANEHERIVIVTHGFVLPVWFAIWLKWDIAMLNKTGFCGAAGGVSFMREDTDGKRVLMRLNDMSYSGEDYRLI